MAEQRWTDEQAYRAYDDASAWDGDLKQGGAVMVGRALLTLEAEVAQLRLNDQKYCERLAWLQAANAAFKGMEAERDAALAQCAALATRLAGALDGPGGRSRG